MALHSGRCFEQRFRRRVLLPGALILLITAILCGAGLIAAGRGTDSMSLMAQQAEVWRATSRGMDELAVAQESVALCEKCITEARSAAPNQAWLGRNVANPLFDLYRVHETYILDGHDRPVFAAVGRRRVAPDEFKRVEASVQQFVKLARGESARPSGRSNLNERLPGSPPEPLVLPPVPGFSDEPTTIHPSVRTTPSTVHATDLVRIGDRIAFVSAMQMARLANGKPTSGGPAPVVVSLRYLDDQFLLQAAQQNYLIDARFADFPTPRDGETVAPLTNSDGVALTTLFWKPPLGGSAVINSLLGPAAAAFGIIALLVLLMALALRRLMKRDDENLIELERAHLELQAKEAQAHHLAYHDALTGLPNRALFNDNVDQAVTRARHGEPMAVLLLDLDRFKNVNDRFGHLAGDELIRQVGKRLAQVVARSQAVARLGGDEFAILLEGHDLVACRDDILDRILEDLQRPYDVLGSQAHVGVSIGVALAPQHGCERTDLMRKADIALYRAKDEGRDCYRFFTQSMDETVQLRAAIESDLRRALNTGTELAVHFQPLVNSSDARLTGLEALLRWRHPTRGWISPQLFVPVAEEAGLISALGDWVLGEACRVALEWPQLTLSINLSPVQFCDETFAERTCKFVREAGVKARQIEFEVTEGVILDQNQLVRGALRRFREEGFRVALDDFGTGYSSLSYLRDFDVDRIKIDKSFIQALGQNHEASAIITAVVTLGRALGLQVTAEGVETSDQEDFLRVAGCNVLQGFLFSEPLPASELRRSMEDYDQSRAA